MCKRQSFKKMSYYELLSEKQMHTTVLRFELEKYLRLATCISKILVKYREYKQHVATNYNQL